MDQDTLRVLLREALREPHVALAQGYGLRLPGRAFPKGPQGGEGIVRETVYVALGVTPSGEQRVLGY
jgi:hypothetical protein